MAPLHEAGALDCFRETNLWMGDDPKGDGVGVHLWRDQQTGRPLPTTVKNIVVVMAPISSEAAAANAEDALRPQISWVSRSDIDLRCSWDDARCIIRATSLMRGTAMRDVKLALDLGPHGGGVVEAQTDADGVAVLAFPPLPPSWREGVKQGRPVLRARTAGEDGDSSVLPLTLWPQRARAETLVWNVWDDRGLYKPGEEMCIMGQLRALTKAGFPVVPGGLGDRDNAGGPWVARSAGGRVAWRLGAAVGVGTGLLSSLSVSRAACCATKCLQQSCLVLNLSSGAPSLSYVPLHSLVAGAAIKYELNDAKGKCILSGTQPLTAAGSFSIRTTLPAAEDCALGRAVAKLTFEAPPPPQGATEDAVAQRSGSYSHTFEVKEFRSLPSLCAHARPTSRPLCRLPIHTTLNLSRVNVHPELCIHPLG